MGRKSVQDLCLRLSVSISLTPSLSFLTLIYKKNLRPDLSQTHPKPTTQPSPLQENKKPTSPLEPAPLGFEPNTN